MTIRLSTGLRNKMMGMEALVTGLWVGNDIVTTITDNGASPDSIVAASGSFITAGFVAGDILKMSGATTVGNDTNFTGVRIASVAALTITVPTGTVDTGEVFDANTVLISANGGCMKDVMRNGILCIYSGSQPANGDTAKAGTLLVAITVASGAFTPGTETNGLEFGDETDGYLEKCDGEVWSGVAVATGTAGWFRFYANATDYPTGGASTTLPRIDGSVGTSGADLNMASTSIVTSNTYTIDSFKLTFPYQYGA